MGVSINHIYYINDMLKGLNDKIRADKENVIDYYLLIAYKFHSPELHEGRWFELHFKPKTIKHAQRIRTQFRIVLTPFVREGPLKLHEETHEC